MCITHCILYTCVSLCSFVLGTSHRIEFAVLENCNRKKLCTCTETTSRHTYAECSHAPLRLHYFTRTHTHTHARTHRSQRPPQSTPEVSTWNLICAYTRIWATSCLPGSLCLHLLATTLLLQLAPLLVMQRCVRAHRTMLVLI